MERRVYDIKRRGIAILLLLLTLVLTALPWGIEMRFMSGSGEEFLSYHAYYELLPFGYGNWFGLLTILMALLNLLMALFCWKKYRQQAAWTVLLLTFALFAFFSGRMTLVGGAILCLQPLLMAVVLLPDRWRG